MKKIIFSDTEFINHFDDGTEDANGEVLIEGRINIYTEDGECYTGIIEARVKK